MENNEREFTISVFTENQAGLLQRVVTVFTRRHINIESLTTSKSSIEGIHRFTIVVKVSEDQVIKLVAALDKQIDVIKAFYYRTHEIVYQEVALYKIPSEAFADGDETEILIRAYNARILSIEPEYIVVEKTGHPEEIEKLLTEFEKKGIFEFVRSGRVSITKVMEPLNKYLASITSEEIEI
ncbi:MAG: acetolactate synthase small subunit [Saprospiraceae bacterium]|nr:acetolactate synthase small subunit [Saprospiraceae bacterium]